MQASPRYRVAMRRIAILIFILLGLQACGTKGPLYLPPSDAPAKADAKTKQ
jgi:predicted small lipoprotein YifL